MSLKAVLEMFSHMPLELELTRDQLLAKRNTAISLMNEYGEKFPGEPGRIGKFLGDEAKPYWRARGKIFWKGREIDVIMRTSPKNDRSADDLQNAMIGINLMAGDNSMLYVIGTSGRNSFFQRKINGQTHRIDGTGMFEHLDKEFFEQLRLGLEWYKR